MNKRPGLRKRLALELFRSIRKNRAKIHELRTLFCARSVVTPPASIAVATAMSRPPIRTCRSKIS